MIAGAAGCKYRFVECGSSSVSLPRCEALLPGHTLGAVTQVVLDGSSHCPPGV